MFQASAPHSAGAGCALNYLVTGDRNKDGKHWVPLSTQLSLTMLSGDTGGWTNHQRGASPDQVTGVTDPAHGRKPTVSY
jgi:hypothetical protein